MVCVAVVAVIAVITRGFGLVGSTDAPTPDAVAQQRCEADVAARMVSPSTVTISGLAVTGAQLDPDVTDLAPLSAGPLAGVEVSRITVRSVQGVAETTSELGGQLRDPFNCRAYFVDGELADTLVVLSHDH